MTDPKEKSRPPIQTRTPGKLKTRDNMFERVRLRAETHPIAEIIGASKEASNQTPATPATDVPLSATPVDTPVETPVNTPVTTPVDTPVEDISINSRSPRRQTSKPEGNAEAVEERLPYLDATHTASEKSIYSVMYRETISKGVNERHFGFKELSHKTGIRSDRTVRVALQGLQVKLSVEIISYQHGNPIGPRYRVYDPKEIIRRRKAAGIEIDPQSKKIIGTPVATPVLTGVATGVNTGGQSYGSTPGKTTPVTPVESTGLSKYINQDLSSSSSTGPSSSNLTAAGEDDEAFADLVALLNQAAKEVTGREASAAERGRWKDVGEVLATELKIAAMRTTVSSAPAFLAAHLRRRLSKANSQQIEREMNEASAAETDAPMPKHELDQQQIQETVNMMVTFMLNGTSIEDLTAQFSSKYRPSQWHTIRSIALAQYGVEKKNLE
jgi:hypothetical protein